MRNLQESGVIADVEPYFAVFVFSLEKRLGIATETQLATLFVVDVFGFDFQNGIRTVVVVVHLFSVYVDKTLDFLERAFFYLKLCRAYQAADNQ
jgi:hypothetical protein